MTAANSACFVPSPQANTTINIIKREAPLRYVFLFLILWHGAVHGSPLQVESRTIVWKRSPLEDKISPRPVKKYDVMPFFKSSRPEVAMRINEALYLERIGSPAPVGGGRTFSPPPSVVGRDNAQQEFGISLNDGRLLTVDFYVEGCGAYCEDYSETRVFDARTGRLLALNDIVTPAGQDELARRLLVTSSRAYEREIERLQQALNSAGSQAKAEDIQELEGRLEFNQECLGGIDISSEGRHPISDDDGSIRWSFAKGRNLVLKKERCSNHIMRYYDDVWEVEQAFRPTELADFLTPYGRSLILGEKDVPEPDNLSGQILFGKIGDAAVTASLRFGTNSTGQITVGGFYFYNKYRRHIYLSGVKKENQVTLSEKGGATITLELDGTRLSGSWKNSDKEVPVVLSTPKYP